MAVGDSFVYSGKSYLGIGRESVFGTYDTATAGIDFLSASIKTAQDAKILEEVQRSRTMAKDFRLGKTVEGELQSYVKPENTATAFLLQNAFGGTVTSATASGETVGGAIFEHVFATGCLDQTYTGISINHRKGPATGGKVWEYHGGRINTLALAAELDEPLMMTTNLIFKDSTLNSNDIESAFTVTSDACLSFASGRFSVENTESALTTTSFWHVQNINFTLNNNLKNDATARRIGSDTLDVLPYGVQNYELSCQFRFNTTTAYDAMLASTEFAAEFEFNGVTASGDAVAPGLKVRLPLVTIKDAGDPEVGGPDETLVSTVTFNVLRDTSTTTGYAAQATLYNLASTIN